MPQHPQWFFRLDELDLLESVYHALSHDVPKGGVRQQACERVFAEQEAAEAQSEEDLDRLLDDVPLEGECPVHHQHNDETSVDEMLASSAVRAHPLAARAYHFFRTLTRSLSDARPGVLFEDLFRVKANAPLIPAKIAFAGIELEHGDAASFMIAEKELEVAELYLSRLLASLATLCVAEVLPAAEAGLFLNEGEYLQGAIAAERLRLRSHKHFRSL